MYACFLKLLYNKQYICLYMHNESISLLVIIFFYFIKLFLCTCKLCLFFKHKSAGYCNLILCSIYYPRSLNSKTKIMLLNAH